MKVKALRGVCIGPGRHLAPGDQADLDPATVQFLENIKAVERVVEKPTEATPAAEPDPSKEPEAPAAKAEDAPKSTESKPSGKSGGKEK